MLVAVQIELNWLLDDAVAAQSSSTAEWKPCSWRHLHSVHSTSAGAAQAPCHTDTKVALRLGLTSLTKLWKQRTQDRWVILLLPTAPCNALDPSARLPQTQGAEDVECHT